MQDETLQVLNEFTSLYDSAQLEARLAAELGRYGFTQYSYLGFKQFVTEKDSVFVATNYPTPWVTRYTENRYVYSDPMMTVGKRSRLPFYWKNLHARNDLSRGQRKILGEGADFGIRNGLTVPIHGPNGEFATLSIASDASQKEVDDLWLHKGHLFHLIGLYYHAALWDNIVDPETEALTTLAPREAEILTWTARGKTAWEISEILGISERTVITHLNRAYEKLDTYGKAHAVAKALVQGLIKP